MTKVLCHGVFDLIHAGHLAYFKAAKKFGTHLTVSITTDRYVNKGPGRPYFTTKLRAEMLKALDIVDEVWISDYPTAVEAIKTLKPNVYVKGPDYRDLTKDLTGEIYNEKAAVEAHGGKLVFTEEDTFSSSTLINKFFHNWTDEQKAQIETINSLGGIDTIEKAIDQIAKLKVLVVGEPILDVYRFVTPEGISSKSPSISARFIHEETYRGGSVAIQSHLLGFTKHCILQPGATQKKIRYISGQQRVFEVTEIQDAHNQEFLIDVILEGSKRSDVVILADFGHGMFEGPVLDAMTQIKRFVGLNVQTNSSNFGFNVYTKHKRYDYLCLDTREARLAEHDRFESGQALGHKIWLKDQDKHISITLGPNGSCLFSRDESHTSPAFSDVIIDATGAGDAYFAITSLLLASNCKPDLIPFIGNVFAGLKTKIIGNKSSVTKASLLKACTGILK